MQNRFRVLLRLAMLGIALFASGVASAQPRVIEREINVRIPDPGDPTHGDPIRITFSIGNESESNERVPLGTYSIGDCSPALGLDWSVVTVTINIFSPFGIIPRYAISGLTFTPPDIDPTNISTTDVGLGIGRIVARNPQVNPNFDYDPQSVSKNIDGEPNFLGTIGDLNVGPPHTELFRTGGFFFGRRNQFTMIFAVGPQFFSPTGAFPADLELLLVVL